MKVIVENSLAKGVVNAIPSKTYAHRVLICDFLAGNDIRSEFNGFTSKDILATANCLNDIKKGITTLNVGESGSTLRFFLPLLSAIGGSFTLNGQGRLMQRPNQELINALEEHGMKISSGDSINLTGKLTSGKFYVKGDISSQYVTGLLMALPLLNGDSEIILTTPLSSKAYVDITIEVLESYGIKIDKTENGYVVYGNQTFKGDCAVEGDWSNMAFFLSLGALSGRITVKGLNADSLQGDKKILQVIKDFGARVEIDQGGIVVSKDRLIGFTVDADDCPDLVPIMAVLGAFAQGKTTINQVQRLKIKESDRILSTLEMLKSFGIKAESDGQKIEIYGGKPTGGVVNSYNDHRIVMASAVMGLVATGKTTILDSGAVDKSYPTFFDDYLALGGKISEN